MNILYNATYSILVSLKLLLRLVSSPSKSTPLPHDLSVCLSFKTNVEGLMGWVGGHPDSKDTISLCEHPSITVDTKSPSSPLVPYRLSPPPCPPPSSI